MEHLINLFAKCVMNGTWEYERVPDVIKDRVDAILIAEGRADLIK